MDDAWAATFESCALHSLGYKVDKFLGPGEIVLITPEGCQQLKKPESEMKICAFLWVYYGYPASSYEGINVEDSRYRCGAALARKDNVTPDIVSGIPDSGIAHAIGYANETSIPYSRPFVKYTPTWPRSFMPQNQQVRELVAKMKLIPVRALIEGRSLLFCEDSIVRGTQLKDTIQRMFDRGAKEVHMRAACPPLLYGCKYLNFSRSKSEMDLAARRAIKELEGTDDVPSDDYLKPGTEKYKAMVTTICKRLGLTSLQYQTLEDLIEAIGLPQEKLCTYCWDGKE